MSQKRKISPAGHRIIGTDTPESISRRKEIREQVKLEKEEIIAQVRQVMPSIVQQRQKAARIMSELRAERERLGISLSELAKRTGMARETIHRLETAKSPNPTISTLHRIADSLGMSLELSLRAQ